MAVKYNKTSYMRKELVGTIIIGMFLVHPTVVSSSFSAWSCNELDTNEFWLIKDYSIQCWTDGHIAWAFNLSLPMIILWGIGVPTIIFIMLLRNKSQRQTVDFRLKFGYITNGYRGEMYFWEFVILYRKILIITVAVWLASFSI